MAKVAVTTEFLDRFRQVASEPGEAHPTVAADTESLGEADDDE